MTKKLAFLFTLAAATLVVAAPTGAAAPPPVRPVIIPPRIPSPPPRPVTPRVTYTPRPSLPTRVNPSTGKTVAVYRPKAGENYFRSRPANGDYVQVWNPGMHAFIWVSASSVADDSGEALDGPAVLIIIGSVLGCVLLLFGGFLVFDRRTYR
jgi:hypothetical protein